ncbi:GNAT family N-acetyltransferase [Anoxybacteroides tepidamans]|uniref:GNAT family N-acetyltransferase n=1 Tax=Anoxybacteroides tepidamans TaxID=265948 RepID=UPI00048254EC|nr:GNAT family N-acetyltransferase [Anoxybacillus tepidamans]
MTLKIKRLSECTFEEAVKAWNAGFEGYYFDATTTVDNFVKRLVGEGLSPKLSIVAFQGHEPIGIVKNGVRLFNKTKIAWNGGTGVASAYRGKGIGKALMETTLAIYQEEGVELATLEAISDNQKAISLYEKMGYEIVDDLEYLELKGAQPNPFGSIQEYIVEQTIPQEVSFLPFYKGQNPWQTQWQSAKDGEALIVKDEHGFDIGYAYYRRVFNVNGKHERTILFQCEAHPERKDAEGIIRFLLSRVFGSFGDDVVRVVPNVPVNHSPLTYSLLKQIGFQPIVNQVWMMKQM